MSYDTSGRDEMARLLKGILGGRPVRLDPAGLQKRDDGPQRVTRALADQLAKAGIGIKKSSGIAVEPPVTRAANGIASNSTSEIAKALRVPAGRLHELHKGDSRDASVSEPEMPEESGNAASGDAHGNNGATWAADAQRGEYGDTGAPKPYQASPRQAASMRGMAAGPEDGDLEAIKRDLSPKNARRIDSKTGFPD
jgi:hypothetical protein